MNLQYSLKELKFVEKNRSIFNSLIVFIIYSLIGGVTCIVRYFIAKIKSIYRRGVSSRNMKGEIS